ncbi:MAG: enoyl-CoA hydratase/isomerase family protein [Myxococcota bacterium]
MSGAPSASGAHLVDRFDLRVRTEAEIDRVSRAVGDHPLSALALVQLLRHGDGLGLDARLVAESWVYSMLQAGPEFARWRSSRKVRGRSVENPGPAIRTQRTGPVLALTLNRPSRHNAFSAEMRDALAESLSLVVADESIRSVTVCGAGPSFCSGGDLDEFGTFPDPATAHAIRSTRNPARLLLRCADRVRFRLHGACIGAGVELPAFGAHVAAREDAFFQLPEVSLGLVPGAGGTASLPRRIGRQQTAWLALTGERIDAARALALGLIDEIAPATAAGGL